jgi:hypothetical protein
VKQRVVLRVGRTTDAFIEISPHRSGGEVVNLPNGFRRRWRVIRAGTGTLEGIGTNE